MIGDATDGRPPRDLDPIAGWIAEANELAHHARVGLLTSANMHGMTKFLELRCRQVQIVPSRDLEARDLNARITVHIAEGVLPRVGFEMPRSFAPLTDLEPENVGRKPCCPFEIACAEPHIADVLQLDHERSPGVVVAL